MNEWFRVLKNGILLENPAMVLMIGLCSTLAVSTQFDGGLMLGLAVLFVLTLGNAIISAIRHWTPSDVRIPIMIVIIASLVTVVDLTLHAFLPSIYIFLGVWIPLIVANCLPLGRAEAFAYHNTVSLSIADGIGMGLGYTLMIAGMALFRELLGTGKLTFLGKTIFALPAWYPPPSIILLFPGAFIIFGFIMALTHARNRRTIAKRAAKAALEAQKGVA
jgi:Na+-translocating ferredoxin:NAD+ oxidoreductase subunit E